MKRLTYTLSLALICAAMACNDAATTTDESKPADTASRAADSPATKQAPPMDSAAMAKAWEAYMTPGDVHAMLAKDNGTWTAEMTMWMTPGAPPQKTTGTMTNKMILGGRYQQSSFKGTFMGQPFEGQGTLAYDNSKKSFISTWIDNMGTGLMVMEGKYDSANKVINFTGKGTDPTTGQDCTMREVFRIVDDNTQVMEMYATYPGASEYKSMEITFRRKK